MGNEDLTEHLRRNSLIPGKYVVGVETSCLDDVIQKLQDAEFDVRYPSYVVPDMENQYFVVRVPGDFEADLERIRQIDGVKSLQQDSWVVGF